MPEEDFEFTRSTIQKILVIYSDLQQDREALLSFIQAPDAYMKERLGPDEMGADQHFHLHHDDVLYPPDLAPPANQLVFTSEIYVTPAGIPEIVEAIGKLKIDDIARVGVYCRGCKRCAIVRMIGKENPGDIGRE